MSDLKEIGGFFLIGAGLGILIGNGIKDVWWIDIIGFMAFTFGLRAMITAIIENKVETKNQ